MSGLLRRLMLFTCLLASGLCFWKAMPGLPDDNGPVAPRIAHASFSPASAKQRLLTTPIQDLRVGMRVIGRNPLPGDAERDVPQPNADTWRLVIMRAEDGTGQVTAIQLLRPLTWIESNGAQPGSEIWLDLPGMDMCGPVEVVGVAACPKIEGGQGSVITGTFQHVSNDLVNVHIDGQAEPIGATSQHPFWSETQHAFIPASQLQIGEEVRTACGTPVQVTSITPRAGPETVYGLEVFGEHVYHVSHRGLLVHNASNQVAPNRTIDGYDVGEYRRIGSHHVIQDAAVRDLPGYNRRAATAVDLGNIRDPNSAHRLTRAAQRRAGGGTYASERRFAYRSLREAGVPKETAKKMVRDADEYFESIGVDMNTVTRIPGDRR